MKRFVIFFFLGTIFSCKHEQNDVLPEHQIYSWNRELYQLTQTYQNINGVKISNGQTEKLIDQHAVKMTSKQAQNQQDSLFQGSKGKYMYRFIRTSPVNTP